ncbi:MAG TPA: hypothetical protein VKA30_11175 [Actinomycetota bacterium]|nr:hypothetical protein [Actinomycetota bacterium]
MPFTYQIEESFGDDGRAQFDPAGCIGPKPDRTALAACWVRVIRCPNEHCGEAWALTLYPASKALFDDQSVAYPS